MTLAFDIHFEPYKIISSLQVIQLAGVIIHVLQLLEHEIHFDC
jgi:hypothetical protein